MKEATKSATPAQCGEKQTWTVEFEHRGRQFKLYKRHQTRSAPYQLCLVRQGRRTRHTLETNDSKTAIDRAKGIIDKALAGKWSEIDAGRIRRPGPASLGKILELYPSLVSLSRVTVRNNLSSMRWLVTTATGEDPAKFDLAGLDGSLVRTFQQRLVLDYQGKAPQTDEGQREAQERALRSSRSVVKQARSLFTRKRGLLELYRKQGVIVPGSIESFMSAPLAGSARKREYHAPPDEVVTKAFSEIAKLKNLDTPVYVAFWLAVGAGLRRKEIGQMQWEYFVERDGRTWISGGIGKDGERIEVPLQEKAVKALAPVRKQSGPCVSAGLEWARRLNYWMRGLGWNTQKKLHELRAYIGSLIYHKDPVAAMRFLRHKTMRQTEENYVRYGQARLPPEVL